MFLKALQTLIYVTMVLQQSHTLLLSCGSFDDIVLSGFFTSNASLISDGSLAPSNRMVSVQFYNDFAPRERIDPTPTTSFRFSRMQELNSTLPPRSTVRQS